MPSRKRGITFDQVTKMALAFPGVEATSSFGTPALKVKGKFMARLREPDVMVLKPIEDDEQQFLMGTQPDVFSSPTTIEAGPASSSACRRCIPRRCGS
jgi:hypothetical protein